MTDDERIAVRDMALGGAEAAQRWSRAMDALHAFAHASGCLPGTDVVDWFKTKTAEYDAAIRKARAA